MSTLANAIVYEVGYRHYNRMNAERLGCPEYRRAQFIRDMQYRTGSVIDYLRCRLTQRRLALPIGYIVGSWRTVAAS